MKKSLILSTFLLLPLSSLCIAASLQSLDKKQVTQMFDDKTITTISMVTLNNKLVNNTATVYFDKQGKLTGQMANKPEEGEQNDQGTWAVKQNGALCATWQHWNNSKPICVYAYQLHDALLLVNQETNNFETLILKDNIKTGNQVH